MTDNTYNPFVARKQSFVKFGSIILFREQYFAYLVKRVITLARNHRIAGGLDEFANALEEFKTTFGLRGDGEEEDPQDSPQLAFEIRRAFNALKADMDSANAFINNTPAMLIFFRTKADKLVKFNAVLEMMRTIVIEEVLP